MFKKNRTPQPSAAIEELNSSPELVSLRAKLEAEKMSRRQALKKMGVTAGFMLVAMPSIDDLARLAAAKLQETQATRAIGDSLAKDLRGAGVAFADTMGTPQYYAPIHMPPKCKNGDPNNGNNGGVANCEDCQAAQFKNCRKKKAAGYCQRVAEACEGACTDSPSDGARIAACWALFGAGAGGKFPKSTQPEAMNP